MVLKIPWISLTCGIHYYKVLMVGEVTGEREVTYVREDISAGKVDSLI